MMTGEIEELHRLPLQPQQQKQQQQQQQESQSQQKQQQHEIQMRSSHRQTLRFQRLHRTSTGQLAPQCSTRVSRVACDVESSRLRVWRKLTFQSFVVIQK